MSDDERALPNDGAEDGDALRGLAGSSCGLSTKRLRFGSTLDGPGQSDGQGCLTWCKIARGGRRPELLLRVNEVVSRFRGRCLPAGRTLDEIEELEQTCAVVQGSSDLVVPERFVRCHLLVRLLGFDENMNLCFQPSKPWQSDDEPVFAGSPPPARGSIYPSLLHERD